MTTSLIQRALTPLALLSLVLCCVSFGLIFFFAPVEATMGIVQKIFYVHVPSAIAMYMGFIIASVCSLIYLIRPSDRMDLAARSSAEVGMVFCVFVLISGPLWGYKAWGKAWVWDPQLTATFVLFTLYGGYILLRRLSSSPRMRMIGAVLAVFAVVDIPVIRYAVKKWGGIHPVVERAGGDGMSPDMKLVFSICMLTFLVLFLLLFLLDLRRRMLAQQIDRMYLELEDLSLSANSPTL